MFLDKIRYDENSPTGIVWAEDTGHRKRRPGTPAGSKTNKGYWKTVIRPYRFFNHRLVWMLHHGPIPEGMTIDHIDRDRGNNRIENLRLATPYMQQRNRYRNCLPYVCFDKTIKSRPYKASFTLDDKHINVGRYETQLEAHCAALARRLELYWDI